MDHCACGKLIPLWGLEGSWDAVPSEERCSAPQCGHARASQLSASALSSPDGGSGLWSDRRAQDLDQDKAIAKAVAWSERRIGIAATVGMVFTGLFTVLAAMLTYVG